MNVRNITLGTVSHKKSPSVLHQLKYPQLHPFLLQIVAFSYVSKLIEWCIIGRSMLTDSVTRFRCILLSSVVKPHLCIRHLTRITSIDSCVLFGIQKYATKGKIIIQDISAFILDWRIPMQNLQFLRGLEEELPGNRCTILLKSHRRSLFESLWGDL